MTGRPLSVRVCVVVSVFLPLEKKIKVTRAFVGVVLLGEKKVSFSWILYISSYVTVVRAAVSLAASVEHVQNQVVESTADKLLTATPAPVTKRCFLSSKSAEKEIFIHRIWLKSCLMGNFTNWMSPCSCRDGIVLVCKHVGFKEDTDLLSWVMEGWPEMFCWGITMETEREILTSGVLRHCEPSLYPCGFFSYIYIQWKIFLCTLESILCGGPLLYKPQNPFVNPSVRVHYHRDPSDSINNRWVQVSGYAGRRPRRRDEFSGQHINTPASAQLNWSSSHLRLHSSLW